MPRLSLLALVALALTAGCDPSDPVDPMGPAAGVLYVGNQGNFSDNSGSLTRYDLETETVTADAVPNLGGLVQNLYVFGDLYVLLNFDDSFSTGRGRVDIVDVETGTRTDQFDVQTPRAFGSYIDTSVGPAEVYVSNLYAGTVTPVNLVTGEMGTPIGVGAAPEGVASTAGRTYVANSGFGAGRTLSVFPTGYDASQGDAVGTIDDVCQGPRTLLADRGQDVWVVCTGQTDFQTGAVTGGAVVVLDGATGAVRQRVETPGEILGSRTFGVDAVYVPASEEVYVIADGAVLRFDAETNTLDARIEVGGAPIGAVAYVASEERLFLGRPDADNPYTEDGAVTIHDRSGAEVGRFGAGLAPAVLAYIPATPGVEG